MKSARTEKSENIAANDQSSSKEPAVKQREVLSREEIKQHASSKAQKRDATFYLVENLLIEMDAFYQVCF